MFDILPVSSTSGIWATLLTALCIILICLL